MPDDSSGIYSLPAGTIVSTGDTILPSQHNPWANDNANAMSNRFSKDGRAPATGNWNLNNFRITNLGAPVATTDAATKAYVDNADSNAVLVGPQLQGYFYGLSATTNAGSPANNITVAVGSAAAAASPYNLIQLLSAITKNVSASWSVGTNNGSLDTGSISNSQYYGYLIQRSDTGVVDVLTSLSATSPTMPASYDRRSPALFTFVRNAAVNGLPTPMPLNRSGWIKLAESIPASATPTIDFLGVLTSVYDLYRVEIDQVGNVTNTVSLQMLVSTNGGGTWASAGYLNGALVSSTTTPQTGENNTSSWVLTQAIINTAGNGANGYTELTRLAGAMSMTALLGGVTTGSTLRTEVQTGLISGTFDSFRLQFTSGNIAANSRVRLYGIVK